MTQGFVALLAERGLPFFDLVQTAVDGACLVWLESPTRHHLNTEGGQALGMRLSSLFTTAETFGIALASAVVAWLSFVDPIWDAYLEIVEGEWLSVAGIAITVSASLIGVACAIYTACK
jgi:hypothetical protein